MVFEYVTDNNAYVICVVTVGNSLYGTIIVTIYRASWATYADTKTMCKKLDSLIRNFSHVKIAGDFNLLNMRWDEAREAANTSTEAIVWRFTIEHDLLQIAYEPSRNNALLDIFFVSKSFSDYNVKTIAPVAEADHRAQLLCVYGMSTPVSSRCTNRQVNLSQVFGIMN